VKRRDAEGAEKRKSRAVKFRCNSWNQVERGGVQSTDETKGCLEQERRDLTGRTARHFLCDNRLLEISRWCAAWCWMAPAYPRHLHSGSMRIASRALMPGLLE